MASTAEPAAAEVVRVRVPERGLRQDLRAVKIVLHRELIRFWRDKLRMVSGLVQPVLWLLVMGTGLSNLMASGGGTAGTVDLKTFIFPGVCAMSVMFTAMFSAGSIVWDREFGFLREMLVAPVSRSAIVVGKCVGGALVATLQGAVIVLLAGLAGVPYDPLLLLEMLAIMFLGAFALTGFGVMMAARITSMQSFFGLMQMAMMPMMFLSGALYPLSGLPTWLTVLTRFNPLTYAVDPLRHAVFARLDVSPELMRTFDPGVTWGGWVVPIWLELLIVLAMGVGLMGVAIWEFRRAD
ncbi:ABC transporter permease [Actinomadura madurae]|uniref:ABC transporter permease n=2 Tax=Actinomadura madurae TaxID=1993 RepID=UPI002026AD81|nr:ABC transporter permease [Actinomadura madurae]MCP9947541.1 ABC transporter permease [Actinomadura madurae]URM93208.1 ABC transporter permease [Actinomadura madurae]URN03932.1 ABC transporter permease [Actinomadura madurae]